MASCGFSAYSRGNVERRSVTRFSSYRIPVREKTGFREVTRYPELIEEKTHHPPGPTCTFKKADPFNVGLLQPPPHTHVHVLFGGTSKIPEGTVGLGDAACLQRQLGPSLSPSMHFSERNKDQRLWPVRGQTGWVESTPTLMDSPLLAGVPPGRTKAEIFMPTQIRPSVLQHRHY